MKHTTIKQAKESTTEIYETHQAEIREILKEIEDGLETHDRAASGNPGGHNWCHIGDLLRIESSLKDISDMLNGRGEYTKEG